MRVDTLLVKKHLVATRTLAQELIKNGQVSIIVDGNRRVLTKTSADVSEDSVFHIEHGFVGEFVSRAGHKLKGAAVELFLDFKNKKCLDVGVSTGGFSDFMLKSGAESVLGIDVGQDQTHHSVKSNPRFTLLEKVNARYLDENKEFQNRVPSGGFEFICMDVSFISARLILPKIKNLMNEKGELLVLVKPQFELGPAALNEKGIVKDSSQYLELETVMVETSLKLGFIVKKYFSSSISGKDGNQEFFLFLTN